jgi:diguanylate cyclase (GGDEF)-like protein
MADFSKRLEKAEKYLQKGKVEDALEEYLAVLGEDPNNEAIRQTAADLCVTCGRAADAALHLSTLFDRQASLNETAKLNVTYKKLARVTTPSVEQTFRYAQNIEKANKKEALECFETAVKGFTAAGKRSDAFAALKHIVALDPSKENYRREGELAAEFGDGKEAASCFFQVGLLEQKEGHDPFEWFERGFVLDGKNAELALAYARALLDHGDAAKALDVIEPWASFADSNPAMRDVYALALLGVGRAADAEPHVWALFEKDPKQIDRVAQLLTLLIVQQHFDKALELTRKLEHNELKAGRRREFVTMIKEVTDKHPPGIEFLEYLVELYNENNREHDYCDTSIKLFDLYYAAGNFLKAGDSLDRAAEVDPYEQGHKKRLEMLRGKIEQGRFSAIAHRVTSVIGETEGEEKGGADIDKEPTVLEDFMLQAEIFLQYSMRSKAVERLERVMKLFPREEERNEKLRNLYMNAGMVPKYADLPPAAPPGSGVMPAMVPPGGAVRPLAPMTPRGTVVNEEAAVDNIARVTEITRNIYRQGNVKSVLFTAVNDVGRHWSASRCVAGLCSPGKPPSAALEYCAPGIKQSDVMSIVKLISTLQSLAVGQGVVALPNAPSAPELAAIQDVIAGLGIQSILAMPLIDGEEQAGILILEQCDQQRPWRQTDTLVLKTIADQTMLAVNNSRLRSLMKTLAVTDEKSGLLKRSSYLDVVLSEVRRATQQTSPATLMLLHFGKASAMVKEAGEAAVEGMMQQIGQIVCSHIRQNDVAVRYDLTTVAVVLADTNDKNAFFVVDKLRKVMAVKVPGTDRQVPVGAGIAEAVLHPGADPVDIVTEVINRAEAALDAAKAEGPNAAKSLAASLQTATAVA